MSLPINYASHSAPFRRRVCSRVRGCVFQSSSAHFRYSTATTSKLRHRVTPGNYLFKTHTRREVTLRRSCQSLIEVHQLEDTGLESSSKYWLIELLNHFKHFFSYTPNFRAPFPTKCFSSKCHLFLNFFLLFDTLDMVYLFFQDSLSETNIFQYIEEYLHRLNSSFKAALATEP